MPGEDEILEDLGTSADGLSGKEGGELVAGEKTHLDGRLTEQVVRVLLPPDDLIDGGGFDQAVEEGKAADGLARGPVSPARGLKNVRGDSIRGDQEFGELSLQQRLRGHARIV